MTSAPDRTRRWWHAIGPAIIVAAVVLGPGSLLAASRVGCEFGYAPLWLLALTTGLMIGTVVVAASVGRSLDATPGGELASRLGRPVSAVVGVTLFLVVVSFQGSNNAAVLASLQPLGVTELGSSAAASALVLLNGIVATVLWFGRDLYRPIERLMKLLVGLMAAAFVLNVALARPSLSGLLRGFLPTIPTPKTNTGTDSYAPLVALVATTYSIAAAYYQCYLVRERRRLGDAAAGNTLDAVFGIAALGIATGLVLVTSAAVLHGNVASSDLTSVFVIADQLRPLFGAAAAWIFSIGILAGALSSFLVNALIGGTLLADGFGWASGLNDRPQKWGTTVALSLGAVVALLTTRSGNQVDAIILMQKLTLLGGPLLAASLLYLGFRVRPRPPVWALVLACVGGLLVAALVTRTLLNLLTA